MKFVYFIPYFIPVAIVIITIEVIMSIRHDKHLYEWKDSAASAGVGIGAVLMQVLTKAGTLAVFTAVFELFGPVRESMNYTAAFGQNWLGASWWVWVLAILGDDFNFYWHHRFTHTIRILWAAHIPHHSSEYFNFGTSFRNSWTIFFIKPVYWLWMPAIGFNPIMVLMAMSMNSVYQFTLHSLSVPHLGWFEKVFNTPQLHQIHHSKNFAYMDKNFGGILIIWDKIFGTFHNGRDGQQRHFGVTNPPASYNPVKIITHEFENIWHDVRNAQTLTDKLNYVFGAPGWSSDKSSLTVSEMNKMIRNGKLTPEQINAFGISESEPALEKEES